MCRGLTEFPLSPFFPPLGIDRVEIHPIPRRPSTGPISSTMLLILIYMTRPTATRNHRRVHRDGNYKFMQPPPSSSSVTGRSKKVSLRAICDPRSIFFVPLLSSVSCFCLFFLVAHLLIDRTGASMDSQNACNGPSRTGVRWIW